MPPPIPQQGSRAGLITAVIVFVVLWLLSTVFFFQERGKRQLAENEREAIQNTLDSGLIPKDTTQGALKQAQSLVKGDANAGGDVAIPAGGGTGPVILDKNIADTLAPDAKDAFTWAITERDELMKLISSTVPTGKDAKSYIIRKQKEAEEAVKNVTNKPAGVNFNMNLGDIAVKLAEAYKALDQAKEAEVANVAAEKKRYADLEKAREELANTHKTALAAVEKQLQDKDAALKDLEARYAQTITQTTQANAANLDALNVQKAALEQQIAVLTPQIPALEKKWKELQGILRHYRMDPTDNMVRRADGTITRVTDDGRTCYINLGQGDHITPGMTFEIYAKETGVPSLKADIASMEDENVKRLKAANEKLRAAAEKGTGGAAGVFAAARAGEKYDTQLPQGGKGAIEVIEVQQGHSALCRIIKVENGQQIRNGDLIANLVYDPNTKFRFGVYGNFDLDYNGIPTLTDTNVIKQRIEQWGGKAITVNTVEDVSPDLDFVVAGVRPVVHPLPENPLPTDQERQNKEKEQQKLYDDALNRAREWSIPVLNQTRFLYYTGYFDQRLR